MPELNEMQSKKLTQHFRIKFYKRLRGVFFYEVSIKNRYNHFSIAKHNFTILSDLST